MPKKPIDLTNSVFYVITSKDLTITDKYVGSTTNLTKRRHAHKKACNNENDNNYNYYVYQFMRANGGWENWEIIELERRECVDKSDMLKRERYWLETMGATLNKNVPSRTVGEYYIQYYEQNREQIKEYSKQHYEDNRDKKLEQMRQYRQSNAEIIECDCGGRYKPPYKSIHAKSIRHINHSTSTPATL